MSGAGPAQAPPARIRRAREAELGRLDGIKRDAAQRFADEGIPRAATPRPASLDVLDLCRAAGTLWVAANEGDEPVGFLAASELDNSLFVLDLHVARAAQGRGLGARLLAAAIDHARWAYLPAVSLTTDRHAPWNAPFYARRGFVILRTADLSPGLRATWEADIARGHDPARRVAMAKRL